MAFSNSFAPIFNMESAHHCLFCIFFSSGFKLSVLYITVYTVVLHYPSALFIFISFHCTLAPAHDSSNRVIPTIIIFYLLIQP